MPDCFSYDRQETSSPLPGLSAFCSRRNFSRLLTVRGLWALWLCSLVLLGVDSVWSAEPEPAPAVTCRGWVVIDEATGRELAGFESDVTRKAASTTKMMAAYVILKLAEENPEVLKERVTFSELAGKTSGSTANISAGESVTVRECLWGLLLPSGNDAGNALAEHFHTRLDPPGDLTGIRVPPTLERYPTRAHFIAEMNRQAQALKLQETYYRLPYGDGGDEECMTTSPRDLAQLARAARKFPLFREIVATPRYVGQVQQPDGTTREQVWINTNKLLEKPEFHGVKTGTTNSARACLVLSGSKEGHDLIVVVLGSAHTESRFADAKNLFDWTLRRLRTESLGK